MTAIAGFGPVIPGSSASIHARPFEPQSKVNCLKNVNFGDKYPQDGPTNVPMCPLG